MKDILHFCAVQKLCTATKLAQTTVLSKFSFREVRPEDSKSKNVQACGCKDMRFGKMPKASPLKETLAGFFGWLGWLLVGWLLVGWLLAGLAWLLVGFWLAFWFWLVWLGFWLAFWLVLGGFWLASGWLLAGFGWTEASDVGGTIWKMRSCRSNHLISSVEAELSMTCNIMRNALFSTSFGPRA